MNLALSLRCAKTFGQLLSNSRLAWPQAGFRPTLSASWAAGSETEMPRDGPRNRPRDGTPPKPVTPRTLEPPHRYQLPRTPSGDSRLESSPEIVSPDYRHLLAR